MKNAVIQRIEHLIKDKDLNTLKFSKEIDFSYSTLNNYISGRREAINIDLIIKILSKYKDVCAEWLILGAGPKYKKNEISNIVEISSNDNLLLNTIIELSGKCALLEDKIKRIEAERGYLKVAEEKNNYGNK